MITILQRIILYRKIAEYRCTFSVYVTFYTVFLNFLNFETHNGLFYTVPQNAWEMILRNLQFIAIFYEFCTLFIAQPNWINHLTRLWAIFKTTQVWNCYAPTLFSYVSYRFWRNFLSAIIWCKTNFWKNFRIPERTITKMAHLVSLSFIICCNTNLVIV